MTEKLLNSEPETEQIRRRCEEFDRNFDFVQHRLERAAAEAGRNLEEIRLLAATKTVPVEVINYAGRHGITLMGENKVQEFLQKSDSLEFAPENIHFIGHLQTNKVSPLIGKVSMIESVDSVHLAKEISKRCEAAGCTMDVLIEVNVGGESSKSGIPVGETKELAAQVAEIPRIRVRGLMTIPPVCEDIRETRRYFSDFYKLFIDIRSEKRDNTSIDFLSMGMSHDFAEAIAEGANIVRVGSALFGERKYS